jgi:hypothetical protein
MLVQGNITRHYVNACVTGKEIQQHTIYIVTDFLKASLGDSACAE